MTNAFEPITIGATTAANRVFMAPMTRNRATLDGVPTELMTEYYTQRAGAGLVITEGIQPSRVGQGYIATPGLHNAEQTAAWRTLTNAVHAAGSTIFAQIMHAGRIGHPLLTGFTPVAPSAVRAPGGTHTAEGRKDNVVPRELTEDEILQTVADHVAAARNALEAGFDGVELHAANGYLLQQFLSDNVNLRTDRWGGSVENRIRFPVEVVKAVAAAVGPERVALRISPGNTDLGIVENDPAELYTALLNALSDLPLAYVHMRETGERDLTLKVRAAWAGPLVLNPLYDEHAPHEALAEVLEGGIADAVALARPYLANPDLIARIRTEGPYNTADPKTFYGGDAQGYTDYPSITSA
ncbi:alkene reductase [Streptomyces sulfonofaciens]|uniref:Alkene reductase n=1 Tax=Streptomyces sulfonofaciens TaxID=68272 RepID=A0A919GMA1_9ACTN|nr:alkene reductase [Streptomyces sulfonofaciens]GHH87157.1 alkene reductase [Streptomyces sulfonofaciens]